LGRKALEEISTIVTPDTLVRWHRELERMIFFGERSLRGGRGQLPGPFS
jgi:hypothetical protein